MPVIKGPWPVCIDRTADPRKLANSAPVYRQEDLRPMSAEEIDRMSLSELAAHSKRVNSEEYRRSRVEYWRGILDGPHRLRERRRARWMLVLWGLALGLVIAVVATYVNYFAG